MLHEHVVRGHASVIIICVAEDTYRLGDAHLWGVGDSVHASANVKQERPAYLLMEGEALA